MWLLMILHDYRPIGTLRAGCGDAAFPAAEAVADKDLQVESAAAGTSQSG